MSTYLLRRIEEQADESGDEDTAVPTTKMYPDLTELGFAPAPARSPDAAADTVEKRGVITFEFVRQEATPLLDVEETTVKTTKSEDESRSESEDSSCSESDSEDAKSGSGSSHSGSESSSSESSEESSSEHRAEESGSSSGSSSEDSSSASSSSSSESDVAEIAFVKSNQSESGKKKKKKKSKKSKKDEKDKKKDKKKKEKSSSESESEESEEEDKKKKEKKHHKKPLKSGAALGGDCGGSGASVGFSLFGNKNKDKKSKPKKKGVISKLFGTKEERRQKKIAKAEKTLREASDRGLYTGVKKDKSEEERAAKKRRAVMELINAGNDGSYTLYIPDAPPASILKESVPAAPSVLPPVGSEPDAAVSDEEKVRRMQDVAQILESGAFEHRVDALIKELAEFRLAEVIYAVFDETHDQTAFNDAKREGAAKSLTEEQRHRLKEMGLAIGKILTLDHRILRDHAAKAYSLSTKEQLLLFSLLTAVAPDVRRVALSRNIAAIESALRNNENLEGDAHALRATAGVAHSSVFAPVGFDGTLYYVVVHEVGLPEKAQVGDGAAAPTAGDNDQMKVVSEDVAAYMDVGSLTADDRGNLYELLFRIVLWVLKTYKATHGHVENVLAALDKAFVLTDPALTSTTGFSLSNIFQKIKGKVRTSKANYKGLADSLVESVRNAVKGNNAFWLDNLATSECLKWKNRVIREFGAESVSRYAEVLADFALNVCVRFFHKKVYPSKELPDYQRFVLYHKAVWNTLNDAKVPGELPPPVVAVQAKKTDVAREGAGDTGPTADAKEKAPHHRRHHSHSPAPTDALAKTGTDKSRLPPGVQERFVYAALGGVKAHSEKTGAAEFFVFVPPDHARDTLDPVKYGDFVRCCVFAAKDGGMTSLCGTEAKLVCNPDKTYCLVNAKTGDIMTRTESECHHHRNKHFRVKLVKCADRLCCH